ncbi:magnesium-protoporphyrin IX monomethyl ester (oxidative) cyclase, partial [Sarracenia purpurea var. burkii]
GICASTSATKHWVSLRKLQIWRDSFGQMWKMGGQNGPVLGQKVTDENRHGDFFSALMKAQPQFLNDWKAKLWARFFCLSVIFHG